MLLWLAIFTCSFMAPLLQKSIVHGYLSPRYARLPLPKEEKLSCPLFPHALYNRTAYVVFGAACLTLMILVPKVIRSWDFPPPTSAFIMCEFMRLFMKMYSYIMVNRSLRIEKKAGDSDPNVLLYPQNVTFGNYMYFLWAPTLVYQISYPRTKRIRLRYVSSISF